jgi:hypothetical protein
MPLVANLCHYLTGCTPLKETNNVWQWGTLLLGQESDLFPFLRKEPLKQALATGGVFAVSPKTQRAMFDLLTIQEKIPADQINTQLVERLPLFSVDDLASYLEALSLVYQQWYGRSPVDFRPEGITQKIAFLETFQGIASRYAKHLASPAFNFANGDYFFRAQDLKAIFEIMDDVADKKVWLDACKSIGVSLTEELLAEEISEPTAESLDFFITLSSLGYELSKQTYAPKPFEKDPIKLRHLITLIALPDNKHNSHEIAVQNAKLSHYLNLTVATLQEEAPEGRVHHKSPYPIVLETQGKFFPLLNDAILTRCRGANSSLFVHASTIEKVFAQNEHLYARAPSPFLGACGQVICFEPQNPSLLLKTLPDDTRVKTPDHKTQFSRFKKRKNQLLMYSLSTEPNIKKVYL